jgi:hypothetical protein
LEFAVRQFAVTLFVVVLLCRAVVVASPLPLTAKEVSLMLRSGYSSDTVMHELAVRHFADFFDSGVENDLLKAGANQELISVLRSGVYKSSDSEMEAAKERLGAQEIAVTKPADFGNKTSPSSTSSVRPAPDQPVGGTFSDLVKGDLVYWHNGALVPFDDAELEHKKIYLLFFSAISSKEGRQLTAQLRDYYNRVAPQHPEFEVIFYSFDRSPFAMENYISQTQMPWPAISYDRRSGKTGAIAAKLVHQIPHFILVELNGQMLSDSGENPANLEKVLGDLDKILAAQK